MFLVLAFLCMWGHDALSVWMSAGIVFCVAAICEAIKEQKP